MPKGGARAGAGRKAGGANLKTREIANAAVARGISPLEVMLENMEFARSKAIEAKGVEDTENETAFRALAQTAAKDAAPYIHPKLANIEMQADVKVNVDTSADREIINKFLGSK